MKPHAIFVALASTGLFASPALAEDCAPLKQIAEIQMLDNGDGRYLVPVAMNGAPKLLLFDPSFAVSEVTDDIAKELGVLQGTAAGSITNIVGAKTSKYIVVDKFQLGGVTAERQPMMVIPGSDNHLDGLFGIDAMSHYDMDVDFGTGRLKYFSQDHCPGKVLYWAPPTVAAISTTPGARNIATWVKLNGKEIRAVVAPGNSVSTMTLDNAKRVFDLTPKSPGVVANGNFNGTPKLASYAHIFDTLTFGGVTVRNARVVMIPDHMNVGGLARGPDLVLGMDILKHLHIYMAAKENTLYVSEGSPPRKPTERMALMDQWVSASPANAGYRNSRCYSRALLKINLEAALEDCEIALKARPQSLAIADSKAFTLYQLGRYQEALNAYNQILAKDPNADSLYMRGYAKKRLGDGTGADIDIAAAKALNSEIDGNFKNARLSD